MAIRSANKYSAVDLFLIPYPSHQVCAFAWRMAHSVAGPCTFILVQGLNGKHLSLVAKIRSV